MEPTVQISDDFINENTDFLELIVALKEGFSSQDIIIPQRHHHDFPNPETGADSTLLLMPAWHPGKESGVKIATVSPENERFELPSIQAIYVLLNAVTGAMKATMQAKSLTAKRTAATSALASSSKLLCFQLKNESTSGPPLSRRSRIIKHSVTLSHTN